MRVCDKSRRVRRQGAFYASAILTQGFPLSNTDKTVFKELRLLYNFTPYLHHKRRTVFEFIYTKSSFFFFVARVSGAKLMTSNIIHLLCQHDHSSHNRWLSSTSRPFILTQLHKLGMFPDSLLKIFVCILMHLQDLCLFSISLRFYDLPRAKVIFMSTKLLLSPITPWSKILPEELLVAQLFNNFLSIY